MADFERRLASRPAAVCSGALSQQRDRAIHGGDTGLSRGANERRFVGLVDQVEHGPEVGQHVLADGKPIVGSEAERGRVDQEVGGADLVCDAQSGGAQAVNELGRSMGCPVQHVDTRGTRLEERPGRSARGAAGAQQQDANPCSTSDQRGRCDVNALDVRVVPVNEAITRPEGVARAGAHHRLAGSIDGGTGTRLVGHGDVAAPSSMRNRTDQRRDVCFRAAECDIHGVDPLLRKRRVHHVRGARMRDGITEQRVDARRSADGLAHGARISSSRSSARPTRRSICAKVRR